MSALQWDGLYLRAAGWIGFGPYADSDVNGDEIEAQLCVDYSLIAAWYHRPDYDAESAEGMFAGFALFAHLMAALTAAIEREAQSALLGTYRHASGEIVRITPGVSSRILHLRSASGVTWGLSDIDEMSAAVAAGHYKRVPVVLLYGRAALTAACPDALVLSPGDRGPYASVLVGVGAECVRLAADLEQFSEQARAAIKAIVLIAPVAPWAARQKACGRHMPGGNFPRVNRCDDCAWIANHPLPVSLGPLEPLRAWAERARAGAGPRLIITAHPEAEVCKTCVLGPGVGVVEPVPPCLSCCGTGRALGSAEVARELSGAKAPDHSWAGGPHVEHATDHGPIVIAYATRADHDREALEAALRRALQ